MSLGGIKSRSIPKFCGVTSWGSVIPAAAPAFTVFVTQLFAELKRGYKTYVPGLLAKIFVKSRPLCKLSNPI